MDQLEIVKRCVAIIKAINCMAEEYPSLKLHRAYLRYKKFYIDEQMSTRGGYLEERHLRDLSRHLMAITNSMLLPGGESYQKVTPQESTEGNEP